MRSRLPYGMLSLSMLVGLIATGCSQSTAGTPSAPAAAPVGVTGGGEFTGGDPAAIAYDRKLVPQGAQASLTAESVGDRTVTSLVVEGFLHNRAYGAHLHTEPCGADPQAAGPHFKRGTDEVWLDFRTLGNGTGHATTRHDWQLDPAHLPQSLVIHAAPGASAPRIACLTLHRR
ncbi:hypothetical protein [Nonomuraea sediminis]|uniref:hypothetical protein n=1 Tax=Nonomuraea sediminis TaxID=2835864 RepID=UPI001BDD9754|nr:hypothetical protein [Nonomuraea sediminis]